MLTPMQAYVERHMPLSWWFMRTAGVTWELDSGPSRSRLIFYADPLETEENQ